MVTGLDKSNVDGSAPATVSGPGDAYQVKVYSVECLIAAGQENFNFN